MHIGALLSANSAPLLCDAGLDPVYQDWYLGLPDFSWYMIPKPEKCTKGTQTIPNGHKISQHFPI
jgi:hypothetical protein